MCNIHVFRNNCHRLDLRHLGWMQVVLRSSSWGKGKDRQTPSAIMRWYSCLACGCHCGQLIVRRSIQIVEKGRNAWWNNGSKGLGMQIAHHASALTTPSALSRTLGAHKHNRANRCQTDRNLKIKRKHQPYMTNYWKEIGATCRLDWAQQHYQWSQQGLKRTFI